VSRDFSLAFDWFRKAALQGHARAQLNVGLMYFAGQGTGADMAQALQWFQLADRNGEPGAARYVREAGLRLGTAAVTAAIPAITAESVSLVPGTEDTDSSIYLVPKYNF
jgi:TPR repeat protein